MTVVTYLMKISFHELKHHVDILEVPCAWRQHDVLNLNNVCRDKVDHCSCAQQQESSECVCNADL